MSLLLITQQSVDTASRAMAYTFLVALLIACCSGAYIWSRNRQQSKQSSPAQRQPRRSVGTGNDKRQGKTHRVTSVRHSPAVVNKGGDNAGTITIPASQYAEMQEVLREALPILEAHGRDKRKQSDQSFDSDAPTQLLEPRELTRTMIERLPRSAYLRHVMPTQDAIPFLSDGQTYESVSLLAGKHIGIFGASQNGKGNLEQLLALSALQLGPAQATVWILDPKSGVDYKDIAFYTKHGRLYADVPNVDGSLDDGFTAVIEEMHDRYSKFQGMRPTARNLREYNSRAAVPLPAMLVIIDEVKMLNQPQREKLDKLAQMAAASGITLLIATTYPTANHLSSLVQANLKVRIVFGFATTKYTEVALGLDRGEDHLYEPGAISEPGVAIVRYEGGREVLGRVPHLTDSVLHEMTSVVQRQYPRLPDAGAPLGMEVSTISDAAWQGASLLQSMLGVKTSGEMPAELSRPASVVSPGVSASASEISRFTVPLPDAEIARIVSLVYGGETKTTIVTGIKGRTSKNHSRYAGYYDTIYNQLLGEGNGPLIEAARQRRKGQLNHDETSSAMTEAESETVEVETE